MGIPFIEEIERFINEHGSTSILRDRIELAKDRYSFLEDQVTAMKARISDLQLENEALRSENESLKSQVEKNNQVIQKHQDQARSLQNSNPRGLSCDHCGSTNLKRTGNRPHKSLGKVGVKEELYTCNDCGKESAFMPPSSKR